MEFAAKLNTLVLNRHVAVCKDACKTSYGKLSSSEKKHVDALLEGSVKIYQLARPYMPIMRQYATSLTVDNVVAFLKMATKLLQKEETSKLVEHYIAMYADSLKDPKRLKAYGAYLRCLMSQLDPKYKRVVSVAIDFIFALVLIVVSKEVKQCVVEISKSVHKHMLKPLHKEVKVKA